MGARGSAHGLGSWKLQSSGVSCVFEARLERTSQKPWKISKECSSTVPKTGGNRLFRVSLRHVWKGFSKNRGNFPSSARARFPKLVGTGTRGRIWKETPENCGNFSKECSSTVPKTGGNRHPRADLERNPGKPWEFFQGVPEHGFQNQQENRNKL